jgi:hypothetical protein
MGSRKNDGSWFDAGRRKPSPPELGYIQNMIGTIYFRTNERTLDQHDREVLNKLATFVKQELTHGTSVELSLVGKADYRGRASHNKWLSEQRVKAVAERLGRLAGNHWDFTGVWAATIGEEQSVQGRDRMLNAIDRAVHIWWGKPKMHIMPKLRRYIFGKGYLDQMKPSDRLIDLSPPAKRRPVFRNSPYIDL